jgi:tetratricopeptide (TPR) repeat protein
MWAMWISRLACLCLAALMLTSLTPAEASAQNIDLARKAFEQGNFAEAAALARPLATPESLALAARAGLAQGDFVAPSSTRRQTFLEAESDARAAIARDPQNVEGHLYLALALGFLGRLDGSLAAHFAGYAEEARKHIDQALLLDPGSAWAYALSGGWNLEIVRDGGMLGETLYGASLDKGVAAYRRALEIESGNAAIAYQYALQLLALGGSLNRAEAQHALAIALKPKPEDAVEKLARRRAQRLKLALDTHDDTATRAILREQLGQPAPSPSQQGLRPGRAIGSPR